jgi:tetratricopeptide (TPR) repeat protein
VSRAADPDDWRTQLRDALSRGEAQAITKLVAAARISDLPVQTICLLGRVLGPDESVPILRAAQIKHPNDYSITFQLAWALECLPRPQMREAIRFYTAAVALRPRNGTARMCLGFALNDPVESPEALLHFHEAAALVAAEAGPSVRRGAAPLKEVDYPTAGHLRVIELQPGHSGVWWLRRANAHAGLCQWEKADSDFKRAFALKAPQADLCAVACLRVLRGDNEGYRQMCRQADKSIGRPGGLGAYDVGRICTLRPDVPVTAARLVDLARKADSRSTFPRSAWCLHNLARAHYRAGQLEQADRYCRESLKVEPAWRGRMLNWVVLAMAHQRQGRPDEARQWLARATRWRDGLGRYGDPPVAVCPFRLYIVDWLELNILLPEAEALVWGPTAKR